MQASASISSPVLSFCHAEQAVAGSNQPITLAGLVFDGGVAIGASDAVFADARVVKELATLNDWTGNGEAGQDEQRYEHFVSIPQQALDVFVLPRSGPGVVPKTLLIGQECGGVHGSSAF